MITGGLVCIGVPICAYAGSYVGEGLGYIWGNALDMMPLLNNLTPYLAERTGWINDSKTAVDLNENLYRVAGAVSGLWAGASLPFRIGSHILDRAHKMQYKTEKIEKEGKKYLGNTIKK